MFFLAAVGAQNLCQFDRLKLWLYASFSFTTIYIAPVHHRSNMTWYSMVEAFSVSFFVTSNKSYRIECCCK